jgi:hypothetical protein
MKEKCARESNPVFQSKWLYTAKKIQHSYRTPLQLKEFLSFTVSLSPKSLCDYIFGSSAYFTNIRG